MLKLLQLLQKGSVTISTISEIFDIPKEEVWPLLDKLRSKGYDIIERDRNVILQRVPSAKETIKLPKITSRTVKILVTSDWGYGLKTMQPSLVEKAIEIGEKEKVWFHLIAGNICAGKPRRGKEGEYFLFDFEQQLDYIVNHFPKTSFKNYLINGPRELSFKNPKSFGEELGERIRDLKYYGDWETSFKVGNVQITLLHIEGEPTPYTKSYILQGVMESYQEAIDYEFEEPVSPQILLVGGIHTSLLIPPRLPLKIERKNNFYGVALPSLYKAPGSFPGKKRKGLPHGLGCLIITLQFNEQKKLKKEPKFTFWDFTGFWKKDDYLEEIQINPKLSLEAQSILGQLNKKPQSKGELSRLIQKSIPHTERIINEIKNQKYEIVWLPAQKRYKLLKKMKDKFKPLTADLIEKTVKFAAISDTHLGHFCQRPDLIKKAYQVAEKAKVQRIYHCGDVFEGKAAYHYQDWELALPGAQAQLNYGLKIWPKSEILTELIRGSSHEASYLSVGMDLVDIFSKLAQAQGKKIAYLGEKMGVIGTSDLDGIKIQLIHPRGGIPYGVSYRPQKRIETAVTVLEAYSSEKVVLIGHLHVSMFMMYKGIAAFVVPCLQEKTPYLASLGHIPWLGMWISEISMDNKKRITKIDLQYHPFEQKKL